MEALSPRSANLHLRSKPFNAKDFAVEAPKPEPPKVESAKEGQAQGKEYASPPPPWIFQPPLKTGLLAEKFHTGPFLGKGGFAICYEGELRGKNNGPGTCKFAMKIVKAKTTQAKVGEKFRTELQIHAKMRHPSIVQFHRAFTYKENSYVILELCPNGSVMDMMKNRKSLSLPEVRRFTVQICGAVKYMHTRNVIHRDLKMGNLFLDKDMNIKLGDFGLAAILVTKAECKGVHNISLERRTTVCGTPNYIAPEILKKGKNGHDHKVDIWAIGVIVYAMLTGRPPFQSNSQREIYERVKTGTYDWPQDKQCINDIPDEAKDLVACLLRADAEQRPEPDQIVGHPFFSMHDGHAIPWTIDQSCRTKKPTWLRAEYPRGDVMDHGCSVIPLSTLAKQCGVGHLPGNEKPFDVVGGNVGISLYKECLEEEIEETYPIVPLPKDMVYTSRTALMGWPSEQTLNTQQSMSVKSDLESLRESAAEEDGFVLPDIPRRGPTQSHAATLRAAQFGSMPSRKITFQSTAVGREDNGSIRAPASHTSSLRARRGLLNEQPIRSAANPSNKKTSESKPPVLLIPRVTRSKSASLALTRTAPTVESVITSNQQVAASGNAENEPQNQAVQGKRRIVGTVRNERKQGVKRPAQSPIASLPVRPKTKSKIGTRRTLIGPDDVVESISGTKPKEVIQSLQLTWSEINASLSIKPSDPSHVQFQSIITQKESCNKHVMVTKWVDYTHKFGMGYILGNGTHGCIFKADDTSPQTCILVPGAETHIQRKKTPSYPDKQQHVAKDGAPVQFLENCAEEGLKRVCTPAAHFQLKIGADGVAEKMSGGGTDSDFEKRRRVCLWNKFAKYMHDNIGKISQVFDMQSEDENILITSRTSNQRDRTDYFIKFFQRLGNVGIWGFGHGSFQFNFPDHTKIVVSDGGAWVDFYHLSAKAAKSLKRGVHLDNKDLSNRSVLSYPTLIMVHGVYQKRDFSDIIVTNEFVAKLEFVKKVFGTWLDCGGLGCLGADEKHLHWEGLTEAVGKLVWVSVGAQGEDLRYHQPGARE